MVYLLQFFSISTKFHLAVYTAFSKKFVLGVMEVIILSRCKKFSQPGAR